MRECNWRCARAGDRSSIGVERPARRFRGTFHLKMAVALRPPQGLRPPGIGIALARWHREPVLVALVVLLGTLHPLVLVLAGAQGPFDPENFVGHDAARLAAGQAREYPPPLYPAFLVLINATVGASSTALFAFNLVTHALTVYATYALARAFLGPIWASVAALLFAAHPSIVGNIALARFESLNTPLVALALLATIRALDAPGLRRGLTAGLLWTAANFIKPITLLFPLTVVPLFLWRRTSRPVVVGLTALLVVGVLGYGPWLIRNQFEYGSIGLSTRYVWFGTTNPEGFNKDADSGLRRERDLAARVEGADAAPEARSAAFEGALLSETLGVIRADPTGWIWSRLVSAYRVWHEPGVEWNWGLRELGFPLEYRELAAFDPAVRFHRVLLGVAAAGLLAALWRRDRRLLVVGMFLAYFTAIYALTIWSPRYFVVALPAVTLLAAVALRDASRMLWRFRRPAVAGALVGGGLAIAVLWALNVQPGRDLPLRNGDFETGRTDPAWQTQAWRAADDPAPVVAAPDGVLAARIDLQTEPFEGERRLVQVIGAAPDRDYEVSVAYRYAAARGPNAYLRVFGLANEASDSVFFPRANLALQPLSGAWNHVSATARLRADERLLAVALGARWSEPPVWFDDVRVVERPGWLSSLRPGGGYLLSFWLPVGAIVLAFVVAGASIARRRPQVLHGAGLLGFAALASYALFASLGIVWAMLLP